MLNFTKKLFILTLITSLSLPHCTAFASAKEVDTTKITQPDIFTGFNSLPEEGVEEGEIRSFYSTDNDSKSIERNTVLRSYKDGDLIYSKNLVINPDLVQKDRAYFKSKSTMKKVFIKYLTGSWAKANSYTWSKSNTVKWEVSGGVDLNISEAVAAKMGLSTSRTTTYSVAVTIPANSGKYSKLGFASDYTKLVYTHKRYMNSSLLYSKKGTLKTPQKNTYLVVYYK